MDQEMADLNREIEELDRTRFTTGVALKSLKTHKTWFDIIIINLY